MTIDKYVEGVRNVGGRVYDFLNRDISMREAGKYLTGLAAGVVAMGAVAGTDTARAGSIWEEIAKQAIVDQTAREVVKDVYNNGQEQQQTTVNVYNGGQQQGEGIGINPTTKLIK